MCIQIANSEKCFFQAKVFLIKFFSFHKRIAAKFHPTSQVPTQTKPQSTWLPHKRIPAPKQLKASKRPTHTTAKMMHVPCSKDIHDTWCHTTWEDGCVCPLWEAHWLTSTEFMYHLYLYTEFFLNSFHVSLTPNTFSTLQELWGMPIP